MFGVLRVSLPLPLTQAQRLALAFRALLREEIKYERKWRRKSKRSSLAQSPGLTGAAHRARHGAPSSFVARVSASTYVVIRARESDIHALVQPD